MPLSNLSQAGQRRECIPPLPQELVPVAAGHGVGLAQTLVPVAAGHGVGLAP